MKKFILLILLVSPAIAQLGSPVYTTRPVTTIWGGIYAPTYPPTNTPQAHQKPGGPTATPTFSPTPTPSGAAPPVYALTRNDFSVTASGPQTLIPAIVGQRVYVYSIQYSMVSQNAPVCITYGGAVQPMTVIWGSNIGTWAYDDLSVPLLVTGSGEPLIINTGGPMTAFGRFSWIQQ